MSGRSALDAQLGGRAPSGVAQLTDPQLQVLADAIDQARRRQGAELASAGEKALALVPRILRGPVRRMLS